MQDGNEGNLMGILMLAGGVLFLEGRNLLAPTTKEPLRNILYFNNGMSSHLDNSN